MTHEIVPVVAETIRQTVRATPTRTLTGGKIWQAVRATYPDFNPSEHAVRNLRDFIRTYVTDINEVSRAGADIVYGFQSAESQQELFPSGSPERVVQRSIGYVLENRQVWKTFTSPSSPWKLFLEPETGQFRVLPPGEPVPGPHWIEVPHCSAEALFRIGQDFIAKEVPESFRPLLSATLEDKKWWLPFFEVLRNVGLGTRWMIFRRPLIVQEFERAVEFVRQQKRAEIVSPSATSELGSLVVDKGSRQLQPATTPLRQLVANAISKMSDAELRALNIPLGYVLDALDSR